MTSFTDEAHLGFFNPLKQFTLRLMDLLTLKGLQRLKRVVKLH